jgi:hypothetical protein
MYSVFSYELVEVSCKRRFCTAISMILFSIIGIDQFIAVNTSIHDKTSKYYMSDASLALRSIRHLVDGVI